MHIIFSPFFESVLSIYSYRSDRKEDDGEASQDRRTGIYDGFSETQTESQVIFLTLATAFTLQFFQVLVWFVTSFLFKHILLHIPVSPWNYS